MPGDPIRISFVDTHTAGEPTRVIVSGGPPLGRGSMADLRMRWREEFDHYRRAMVCEPRGSDVMVGAWLCPADDAGCEAGVIFFNNTGYLGMCGHGAMGVAAALDHLGRIAPGCYALETPAGKVTIEYQGHGKSTVCNVASYRFRANAAVQLEHGRLVHGDIAYGGNWFFLVDETEHRQELALHRTAELTQYCADLRRALRSQGITGQYDAEIDHVELYQTPDSAEADSRNFVLCPGGAYDRSPCGTGTSAKIACLAAEGLLAPGEVWRQRSIVGSLFEASYDMLDGAIMPRVTGSAYVTACGELLLQADDPLRWGFES